MSMKTERRRDSQQWLLDHMVKTTGRVINFAYDQRIVPPEVKSYAMIPRVVEKHARHIEQIARAAEAAGHHVTAGELYWLAGEQYREAQHAIFEDDNPEKIYLHGKLLDCFGRGVLLDIPKMLGLDWLPDGFGITPEILDQAEARFGVRAGRGDFLLVRTGHLDAKLAAGTWDGYSGGDAPGLAFETLDWLHARQVAGIATDTWGVEVRPNQTVDAAQPWHWIAIPIIGLSVGEIFTLAELAADCAADGRYEFMFVAPALPITGAVGSPINPLAIK